MLSSHLVWLADFHLTAVCLLLLAGIGGSLIRQPAKRLVVAWATTLGLALLFVLAALPGWSVWSLAGPGVEARPVVILEEARPPTDEEALVVGPNVKVIPTPTAPADAGVVPPPITVVAEVHEVDLAHEAARIVLPCYLLGVALTAVWLLVGGLLARRLIRRAEEADPATRRLLEQLSDRSPRLLVSDRLSGPVAIGLLRQAIVLPRRLVDRADEAELRAVFAHELTHLRGGDLWLLAGLRLLMIPLWCNPLYWLLRRRVRLDQETLADAAAADQADRHAYAERLVGWARELRPQPQLAGAAGLWESPSQLRKRVAVLLDDSYSVLRRSTLGWRVACGAACLATAVAASLVTLGPVESTAGEPLESEVADGNAGAEREEEPTNDGAFVLFPAPPTGVLESMKPGDPNSIAGRCVDAAGEPLAGVEVLLFLRDGSVASSRRLGATKSDAAGEFRFDDVLDDLEAAAKSDPMNPGADLYVLVARRAGYASQTFAQHESQIARGQRLTFRCKPAGTLTGRVTDADGLPVSGARVRVAVAGSFDLGDQTLHVALTDEEGRYVVADLPAGDFAAKRAAQERERKRTLEQGGNGFITADFIAYPSEVAVSHPEHAIVKQTLDRVPGTLDLRMERGAMVEGRVIHDQEASVAGLTVQIQPDVWSYEPGSVSPITRTVRVDAEGRYRFVSLPAGDYFVRASGSFERDLVTLPVQKVRAVVGEPATAPDLVVSDGRVVRFQLVDAETKAPLTFEEPLRGFAFYALIEDGFRYGANVGRNASVGVDGQFTYRVANRAVQMQIDLPLPTDHPQGVFLQGRVEMPAGEVEQPFPLPIDMRRVTGKRPRVERLIDRAFDLERTGKLDEAIEVLTKAIAERPKHADLLLSRGRLLVRAKRDAEAIADYELAMDQEPEFLFGVQNNLAHLLATTENPELRDPERAVQLARKALEGATHPLMLSEVYDTLATALEAAGDTAAAERARKKSVTVMEEVDEQRGVIRDAFETLAP